ncbi:MAG: hypothetical protein LQ343_003768 [Gyalolechia ehrenbergii]|nr:MAG: hypothetical protein LQ343_003768 [Gyalolechia ehrenbergii]
MSAIALVASGGLLGSQIIVGIISFMNPLLQAGLGLTAYVSYIIAVSYKDTDPLEDAVAHMIEGGPHRTLPQNPALKALQKSQTQQFKGLVL